MPSEACDLLKSLKTSTTKENNHFTKKSIYALNPRDTASATSVFDLRMDKALAVPVPKHRIPPGLASSPVEGRQESPSGNTASTFGLKYVHKEYPEIKQHLLNIVGSLGNGSLGVVEEVRVSNRYPSFVRKRVQIPYYKRKQYLAIMKQEARVLSALSHCHVVNIIGTYGEYPDSGRQFYSLLMSPVGDRDLKTFLDMVNDEIGRNHGHSLEGYRIWDERIINHTTWLSSWFRCLSSALMYMHGNGVRHQDIKPQNIIHRGSAIYFTDFSSASQFQIGQTTSTENPARRSDMYAAPEVINNDERLNRHGRGTDVFALGAVFSEMLAVLRRKSLEEFHQYILRVDMSEVGTSKRPGAQVARGILLYGRKIDHVKAFFSDDDFFNSCIAPMLSPDREQRPGARAVFDSIRGRMELCLPECTCEPYD